MLKITNKNIKKYSNNFNKSRKNILAKNTINNNLLSDSLVKHNKLNEVVEIFSDKIDIKSNISNQHNSGRCWIFSFCNLLKIKMIKKYKLEENFEFSYNYLTFWHYFESANFFLYKILKYKKSKLDDREIHIFLKDPISDGGNWPNIVNIVSKYGLIPKNNMKETLHSNSTVEVLHFISNTLRKFAYTLRELPDDISDSELETMKDDMMETIYKILVIFFSEPPETIEWEYYKSHSKGDSKKYKKTNKLTPLEFYKKIVPFKLENNICLINYPCKTKPYYRKYNCEDSGNMVDGVKTNYYNLPIELIKEISRNSLKNQEALWFGCDVGKYSNYELGILDSNLLDYESIFDFTPILDKCSKLDYLQGEISHAMLLRGTNIINKGMKNETSNRWLVENSWGEENTGKTGNFTMSDDWFSENVYMVVVDKKYIKKEILKEFEKHDDINLPLWSPFGELL